MTAWDIDPAGVRGVVLRTQGVAQQFEGELKAIGDAMTGGAQNGSSQIVADAISGFAQHAQADIAFVLTRTGNAMAAAVNATTAYVEGDLEMAATAQRSATAAPTADTMPGRGGGRVPR